MGSVERLVTQDWEGHVRFPELIHPVDTETHQQRLWVIKRDRDFREKYLTHNPQFLGKIELTHIISPRAVLWGIIHLSANHGPDIFDADLETSIDYIQTYKQIKSSFFPRFLSMIRLSESNDPFYEIDERLTDDERVCAMIPTFGLAARLVTTDPRNIVAISRKFNDFYTPERGRAAKRYGRGFYSDGTGDNSGYVEMIMKHEFLAEIGEINPLVHPSAEKLQEYAIRSTHRSNLSTYPDNLRKPYEREITYGEMLQLSIDLNSLGSESPIDKLYPVACEP